MKFLDHLEKLETLRKLIWHQNTGTPTKLAKHLKVSEKTVLRMVDQLKQLKYPVAYSRFSQTYYFKKRKAKKSH